MAPCMSHMTASDKMRFLCIYYLCIYIIHTEVRDMATPVKRDRKCITCGDDFRRLSSFTGRRVSKDLAIIPTIISIIDIQIPQSEYNDFFICEICLNKVTAFISFKSSAREAASEILKRVKRCSRTPSGNEQKRSKVVDQLVSSVEKLKLKTDEAVRSSRKSLFTSLAEPITSCSTESENPLSTSANDGPLLEHAYMKVPLWTKSVGQADAKESMQKDAFTEILMLDPEHNISGELACMKQQIIDLSAPGVSVLSCTSPESLSFTDVFKNGVLEFKSNCEFLFKTLNIALGDKITPQSKAATLATIYGMILHCHNNKISAVQRLYTTAAIKYHADNKLLSVLNKVHITLSDGSKTKLLDSYAKHCEERLIQTMSAGADGKLNGDNLDLRVDTNDIRMLNKSKDYHFFASDFVLDRIDLSKFSDDAPQGNVNQLAPEAFLPNPEEIEAFKNCLKYLLGRKLSNYMDEFSWMKKVIPLHMPHDLQDDMAKQSSIFILPIMLKNEASYSDCVSIMDQYVTSVNRWYAKAGRGAELEELKIPVGGDQLTRVRLQGAKRLRLGAHTSQERFDQLDPIIVEMFHTLMDFLEKLCKKFLNLQHATDKATLAHIKMVIQRSNVNGKVKVRFKAHEQFVDTVGTAYLLSLAKTLFGMKQMSDKPTHSDIPENIDKLHMKNKEKVFHTVLNHFLDTVFIPPMVQDTPRSRTTDHVEVIVYMGNTVTTMQIPVQDGKVEVKVTNPTGHVFVLHATTEQITKGFSVNISGFNTPVTVKKNDPKEDDLHNYVVNYMNWYFILLSMQDAILEGNVYLTNIILKFMIPLFYSHSSLSKYMVECIDYIMKTEVILTQRVAMKVRAASFVNTTGRIGHNKAADMQKENQVRVLKDLIRGLGSNKTEASIIKISKVVPVIEGMVDNLKEMTGAEDFHTTHGKRSDADDIMEIVSLLQDNNPWQLTPGRQLQAFHDINKSPYCFSAEQFKACIMATVDRLKRAVPTEDSDEDSDRD